MPEQPPAYVARGSVTTPAEDRPFAVYSAQLLELEDDAWTLLAPVGVVIEDWAVEFVARIPDLNMYGSSHIEEGALRELKERLIDLRVEAASREIDAVGEPLRSQLRAVTRLVVSRG